MTDSTSHVSMEPWHPISDPVDLNHLGKLVEEFGEGVQAVGRCIIQGMDEENLKEGCTNRICLENEIADILCNIDLVVDRFSLDRIAMQRRINEKAPKLRMWHKMA